MALWSTELPAQSTQLRQLVSLSPLSGQVANWKPVELTAIVTPDCTGSIPARGLANQATWTFFQPADLETRKCKGSHRKLLMNAIVKDTSKHTKTLDIFHPDNRSDSTLSHCS